MRLLTISSVLALAHYAAAIGVNLAVTTTSIVAGSPVTITFTDGGQLSSLTTGTVVLWVGGNNVGTDSKQLVTLGTITYASATTMSVTFAPGLAGSVTNGFYLQVTSAATDGSTYLNYSPRFSITGMVGITEATYVNAAAAAGTAVPNAVQNKAAAAANPDGGTVQSNMFSVPYESQLGLTKYAPMQPIPPTQITKKGNPTPMYPTSAYTIASAFLPPPTILTTLTLPQTSSVSSMENTAAPQSHPQAAAMKRYLDRWKD